MIAHDHQKWVDIAEQVYRSGKPNKDGCRIEITSKWNVPLLNVLLKDYHDKEIIDYLVYGWPIVRDMDIPLEMAGINHKGATNYADHVDRYLEREIKLGATIGPFEAIPFKDAPVAISPLSTREKKQSESRRIIMDCSWPLGVSLNDGIDKDQYMGSPTQLKYPTTDQVTKKIYQMSTCSNEPILLFKEDMDRAFRQLGTCPSSISLEGSKWRGKYYFDLVLVMGSKIAPYICQRTSSMIAYIQSSKGFFVVNYVDDFLGVEYRSRVYQAHEMLKSIIQDIGLTRSESKSVAPSQVVEFVGNLLDTSSMTVGVTPQRKIDVMKELDKWRYKVTCTRQQVESLVGKLQFISNCVKPGRLFVSRLLNEMKKMRRGRWYPIKNEIRMDIRWWYNWLPMFWWDKCNVATRQVSSRWRNGSRFMSCGCRRNLWK